MARLLKATAILLASAQVRGDATSLLRGEDAVKAAVPADFVEFRWPNPEDADRPELSFRFDVLESTDVCGYPNLTINGSPLPDGGEGTIVLDSLTTVVARWDSVCIMLDGQPQGQRMNLNVDMVNGKVAVVFPIAVNFQQVSPVWIGVEPTAAAVTSTQYSTESLDEQQTTLDFGLAELEALRYHRDYFEQLIDAKEQKLAEDFGWSPREQGDEECETLGCFVNSVMKKVTDTALSFYADVTGVEELFDGPQGHLPKRPWFKHPKHHPKHGKPGRKPHKPHCPKGPHHGWPHRGNHSHHGNHTHGNHTFPHPPPWRRPHKFPHHPPPPPPFCRCPPPHHGPPFHGPPGDDKPPHPPPGDFTSDRFPNDDEDSKFAQPAEQEDRIPEDSKPETSLPRPVRPPPSHGKTHGIRPPPPPGHGPSHHHGPHPLKIGITALLLLVFIGVLHRRCSGKFASFVARRRERRQRRAKRRAFVRRLVFGPWRKRGGGAFEEEKAGLLPGRRQEEDQPSMEREIASCRMAADVVSDMVAAAEEGRARSDAPMRVHAAAGHVSVTAVPVPVVSNSHALFAQYDPDDEALPAYDDTSSDGLADGLRYTPGSSMYTPSSTGSVAGGGADDILGDMKH